MPTEKKTADGYSWTPATGVRSGGLRCRGVVEPSEKRTVPSGHIHDAIVIGAGYAGLMAAREMTDHGGYPRRAADSRTFLNRSCN